MGGGAVALAVAARLAARTELLLLERHPHWGQETSSRNSEVIHAGFYYPEGSWKARLCVRGNALLYERCRGRNIAHRPTTKIVTAASPEERATLARLCVRGRANGVDLRLLTAAETHALEPPVRAVGGPYS